jgi:hypothetical protein
MRKKIFFIHVPKTAGSSFNAFLADNFTGDAHCEKYIDPQSRVFRNLAEIRAYEYVSGHLNFVDFQSNDLTRNDYFVMTFLRDPVKQLISHINWVIHIFDISEAFFKGHPKIIQNMSLELRSLNLNDPDQLIPALKKHTGLFQNNQAKYFRDKLGRFDAEIVINNLSTLDLIGLTEEYEGSVRKFIDINECNIEFSLHKKNRNLQYRLKPETLLSNESIKDFINTYNKIDLEIYDFARQNYKEFAHV